MIYHPVDPFVGKKMSKQLMIIHFIYSSGRKSSGDLRTSSRFSSFFIINCHQSNIKLTLSTLTCVYFFISKRLVHADVAAWNWSTEISSEVILSRFYMVWVLSSGHAKIFKRNDYFHQSWKKTSVSFEVSEILVWSDSNWMWSSRTL